MNARLFGIVVLGAALTALAGEPPNLSGQWKRQEQGQKMSLHGPRDLVLTIRHQEPSYYQKAEGITGMSTPFVEILECDTTGKPRPQPSKLDAAAAWESATLVVRYLKNGQAVATARMTMSADGKQLKRDVTFSGRAPISELYVRK